jgi:hypothetical protein
VLIGAEVEGSTISEAVPVEGVVPEAEVVTGAVTKPAETAAPEMTEEAHDDALPETSLDSHPLAGNLGRGADLFGTNV